MWTNFDPYSMERNGQMTVPPPPPPLPNSLPVDVHDRHFIRITVDEGSAYVVLTSNCVIPYSPSLSSEQERCSSDARNTSSSSIPDFCDNSNIP
ncbi:hypothetical protein PoB_000134500 [Plakobranchus ocellatus]|uniref:Uncharacterized protein n=1 Tax=Plakobranchus ocellatus TaxID=259542 RepID=A0AAV3XVK4_9GAST|nr:hypothetical protein PoB_000134500 [Plakobranchus ocellatus]